MEMLLGGKGILKKTNVGALFWFGDGSEKGVDDGVGRLRGVLLNLKWIVYF